MIGRLLIIAFMAASPAGALELTLPGSTLTRTVESPAGSVRLPDEPWTAETTPTVVDGAIRRRSFRLSGGARTTLQLISPIREALSADGFEAIFTCADAACGGFDFRFQLDILGEPEMHVDLGRFRYLLMRRDPNDGDPHTVSIVASRSATAGYVHVTEVSTSLEPEDVESASVIANEPPVEPETPIPQARFIVDLEASGHAVLDDLDFRSGSAELGDGPFESLESLSAWLQANPSVQIALVGHTDAVGSLTANTALSRARAESVARRLIGSLGAPPGQIQAHGAGYLAPRASNLAEDGRALNRRVEVVLLSRQ